MTKPLKLKSARPSACSSQLVDTRRVRTKSPSKLDQVEAMLKQDAGVSIAEIMTATEWQQHSVRGALAGALKKRGLVIASAKVDGTRLYRAVVNP